MLKALVGRALQARRAAGFRAFEARSADLRHTQERLLLRLVARNGHSALARRLGADRIRSLDALQRLPLTDYDTLAPELERALAGEPDQLVAGRPPFFALTSGTSGRAKHIPIDEAYRAEFQGTVQHFLYGIVRDHPAALAHHALYLAGPARVATTPGGAAVGTISGWNLRRLPRLLRGFYAVPPDAFEIADASDQAYTTARFALARELSIAFAVTTAPLALVGRALATRFEALVRDVHDGTLSLDHPLQRALVAGLRPDPRRARELTRRAGDAPSPRTLWPTMRLIACWHHASAGSHLAELRARWGEVPIRPAIYSATEAWMNVPLEDAAPGRIPAGVLACDAVVLELMKDGVCHLAHALPGPGRYEVVLTSGAGLWRYRLGDEVDVTDAPPGRAPRFAFAQKAGNVLSVAHDMTSESHVRTAVASALPDCARWVFGPSPSERRYRLVVPAAAIDPGADRAAALDAALRAANLGYDLDRADGLIDPIELAPIPADAFERWSSRPGHLAQAKAVVFVKRAADLPSSDPSADPSSDPSSDPNADRAPTAAAPREPFK